MALVERDLRDRRTGRVHRVQVQHALAFVFVEGEVGLAGNRLQRLRFGLAVRREHEAAAGRQVSRVDVVGIAGARDAAERAAGEATGRHVVFPDVPGAGTGCNVTDLRGVRGRALHREHDLLAVVGHLGVGRIALALGELRRHVVLRCTRRRFFANDQVAPFTRRGAVGRVHLDRVGPLHIGDRHVAVHRDGSRVAATAAATGQAGSEQESRQGHQLRVGSCTSVHRNPPVDQFVH